MLSCPRCKGVPWDLPLSIVAVRGVNAQLLEMQGGPVGSAFKYSSCQGGQCTMYSHTNGLKVRPITMLLDGEKHGSHSRPLDFPR